MKLIRPLGLALLIGCGVQQNLHARMPVPVPTNAVASRIIQLWNGRDLTGWKPFFTNEVEVAKVWSAHNGVLSLAGKPNGYLRTERSFANYHLHVEWRWPQTNGNSGLFVHLAGADAIWPRSVECQLKMGAAGELIGQGGVDFPGPVINGKKRAKITTASEKPAGEWNRADVYCRGDTIEVMINGERQNLIKGVSVSEGAIGLQLEGHAVEFREVWLEPY